MKIFNNFFRYNTTFKVYCKGRTFNKTILDAYSSEYRLPKELCQVFIEKGLILLNEERVKPDYKIQNGDRWSFTHPATTDHVILHFDQIEVVFQNDDYLVLNKPCGLPVHPSGRYRSKNFHFN